MNFGHLEEKNVDLWTGKTLGVLVSITSGHLSKPDLSGSPPLLNVNWVICGGGIVSSRDLHTHVPSVGVVQRSPIKHLQHA